MTYEEILIRDYEVLIEKTVALIEDYGRRFWNTDYIHPSDIEFDLERRIIN